MPIPQFTIDGVLPPFLGAQGPGGSHADITPYPASALEVTSYLGGSARRLEILSQWLDYRASLRALGFTKGFQWLDGSFVEKKDPNDLDIVTFLHRPLQVSDPSQIAAIVKSRPDVFDRQTVKSTKRLDVFFVDLSGSAEGLVGVSRYWLGLFSHRRGDGLWKGMLQVRLEDQQDDVNAKSAIGLAINGMPIR